jgi:type IV pilus assembly protein PilV
MQRLPALNQRRTRGFSLIETMVSLALLAVVLVGTTSTILNSKRFTDSGDMRIQANLLSQSIVERIRANPATPATYVTTYANDEQAEEGEVVVSCTTSSCSSSDLAQSDLTSLKSMVSARLPDGQAEISLATVTAAKSRITVNLRWNDRGTTITQTKVIDL